MSPERSEAGSRRLAPAAWAVLTAIGLLAISAFWIGVRAASPTEGAPVLTDAGYAEGFTVDPLESDPTPLRSGDVVVGIEGVAVDALLKGSHVRTPPFRADTTWRYDVIRDGARREIDVPVRDGHLVGERLREGTPILLVAAVLVALGAWTVFRRPDHPAAHALLVLGAGFTSYQVFQLLCADVLALSAARPVFAFGIAGHVGSLAIWSTAATQLAVSFPEPVGLVRRRRWLVPAVYVAMFIGTAGIQGGSIATGAVGLHGLQMFYTAMEVALWALVVVTVVALARTIWRSVRDPVVRRQGALVALGMATTVVIVAGTNVVGGDQPLPVWFVALAFVPMPTALAAAIVRGEWLDLRATINRALVFVSVTGALLGVYAVVVSGLGTVVERSGLAATLPATAVVAVALAPLRGRLQRVVDRVIYGQRGDPGRVLADLGRRLEAALPVEQVLPLAAETVTNALRLPYIAIRINDGATTRLVCERGEPIGSPEIVPLVHKGRSVGELAVAPRRGQRGLARDDHAVLHEIARQLATAVDASRLLTDLAVSHSRLAVAREEERARLRHDLHDRLGSQLVGLSLQLDTLQARTTDTEASETARKAYADVQSALDDVRRISRGLRPADLDELGLIAAINAAAARLSLGETNDEWSVTVDAAVQLPDLPPVVASAAYHITTEAITNAYRHSGGTSARVHIGVTADGSHLTVEIADNGHGIEDTPSVGVGLDSMHARAAAVGGTLTINGDAAGTAVRAELPIGAQA